MRGFLPFFTLIRAVLVILTGLCDVFTICICISVCRICILAGSVWISSGACWIFVFFLVPSVVV